MATIRPFRHLIVCPAMLRSERTAAAGRRNPAVCGTAACRRLARLVMTALRSPAGAGSAFGGSLVWVCRGRSQCGTHQISDRRAKAYELRSIIGGIATTRAVRGRTRAVRAGPQAGPRPGAGGPGGRDALPRDLPRVRARVVLDHRVLPQLRAGGALQQGHRLVDADADGRAGRGGGRSGSGPLCRLAHAPARVRRDRGPVHRTGAREPWPTAVQRLLQLRQAVRRRVRGLLRDRGADLEGVCRT